MFNMNLASSSSSSTLMQPEQKTMMNLIWHAPKSLVEPTWGSNYVEMWKELELGAAPDF
jgi:hypothetical protein